MRVLLASIAAALVTFALVPAAFADPAADVKAAYAAWDEAFNKGDAKAVAAFYTDDAVFLPATHDVIKGPSGVENFFAPLFKMGVTGHKLDLHALKRPRLGRDRRLMAPSP